MATGRHKIIHVDIRLASVTVLTIMDQESVAKSELPIFAEMAA